jgi:RNA polymerase sigma factor (sigma-70 family)
MSEQTVEEKPTQDWSEEMYAYLWDLADKIATTVHRKFPMVDQEDLLQEGLMWAVAHPGRLEAYLENEDVKRGTAQIAGAMKNCCRDYARKQRADLRDGDLTDDIWYQLGVLKGTGRGSKGRGLLHLVFDDQAWLNPEKPEGDQVRRSGADPAEGNNWLATLSDVKRAIELIPAGDRWYIECHYQFGQTYETIGGLCSPPVSRETVSKRIDRAIKKVQDILGGPRPRKDPEEPGWDNEIVGTRHAISNAHARALTDNAYES